MSQLTSSQAALVRESRVAHLATADSKGVPHLIPICFVYDGDHFYSVLDRKPKRISLRDLKRVRNILSNPKVALVVDHYEEDWRQLWYVLVAGTASLMEEGEERSSAIGLLREKYDQYRSMDIDENPVIRITPASIVCWGEIFRHGADSQ